MGRICCSKKSVSSEVAAHIADGPTAANSSTEALARIESGRASEDTAVRNLATEKRIKIIHRPRIPAVAGDAVQVVPLN